jgi:molybdenum cofactor guanylyltransferase
LTLGAAILAGGASSRMGEDKAVQLWAGHRAVDLVVALAGAAGATEIVTVGGDDYGWPQVPDAAPLAGPVGGILAGVAALAACGCDEALILAVDSPTIRLNDLWPLLAAPPPGAAFEGLHLPMRVAISALPADAEAGWPIRRLIERAGLARLPCPPGAKRRLRGANTPEEQARLMAEALELGGSKRTEPPAPPSACR